MAATVRLVETGNPWWTAVPILLAIAFAFSKPVAQAPSRN
jgi:hypothetical protein